MRRGIVVILVLGAISLLFLLLARGYLAGLARREAPGGRALRALESILEKRFPERLRPGVRAAMSREGDLLEIEFDASRGGDRGLPAEVVAAAWEHCRGWERLEWIRVAGRGPDATVRRTARPRPGDRGAGAGGAAAERGGKGGRDG